MTLLHQAAQKAVEAALRRAFHLGQIYWQQADSESRAQNRQAETTQLKFDTLIAETLSALQQQEVPREPVALERWGRAKRNGSVLLERMADGYWTPWHIAQEALAASPSTTQQQEAGSGWKLVPVEPTPEMIAAYLRANDAYWKRTDELPTPPNKWRTGTPSDATAESYRAMLAAAPSTPESAEKDDAGGGKGADRG